MALARVHIKPHRLLHHLCLKEIYQAFQLLHNILAKAKYSDKFIGYILTPFSGCIFCVRASGTGIPIRFLFDVIDTLTCPDSVI